MKMKRAMKLLLGLVSLSSLLSYQTLPAVAGQPFVTLTYNLEQMVDAADRIFVGKVIDTMEDYIQAAGGELPVTVYTFEVDEVLRGDIGNTLTIQQFGHRSDVFGRGMPHYKVGSTVVLFLHADSQYGLTSPVGLGQGDFLVKMDGARKVSVSNSRGNQGLLQGPRIDAMLEAESPEAAQRLKSSRRGLPYGWFRGMVIKLLQP